MESTLSGMDKVSNPVQPENVLLVDYQYYTL